MQQVDIEQHSIIKTADDLIVLVEGLGFTDAIQLLKMARLELLVQLNGISENELKAFARAVRRGEQAVPPWKKSSRRKLAASPQPGASAAK